MQEDLELVSGDFLFRDIPKSKSYLTKYFKSSSQKLFLVYYLTFPSLKHCSPYQFYRNFTDHTGVVQERRTLQHWLWMLRDIEGAMEDGNKRMDFELIEKIRVGLYKRKTKPKPSQSR